MSDGVPELACRKRLRSYDTKVKNKEEKKMHNYDEEEEMKMWNGGDNKVKNRNASTAILEKEKRRKMPINLSDDDDEKEEELEMWDGDKKVKSKEEKRMRSGDDKVGNRKASTATFEKEKKKKMLSSHGSEKKMQSGDLHKDKRMSASLPLNKNNNFLKEKKKKMVSSHSGEKKMHSVDHDEDKRKNVLVPFNKSKRFEKEKKKMLSSHNGEKNMCCDHHKDKRRSVPLSFGKNKMHKNETKKSISPITCATKEKKMRPSDCMEMKMQNGDSKEKKKNNTPPVLSKENKIHTLTNNRKENKRKEQPMLFKKKKKKTRIDDKDNKEVGSDATWKEKKILGDKKEQNMHTGAKEQKRSVSPAFFKVICKNFKEFLLIPPAIASKFADLTNRHVYLEDSEGKSSKIRLSVVDGSLAFHQGWDNFVSDYSIKWGDFLLFEYTAMSKFSVRVFGMDCCERLCFNVEREGGGKKQKESNAPDDLVPCDRGRNSEDINNCHYVSGEYLGSKGPKTKADGYMNNCEIGLGNLVAKSMNAASRTRMTANTKEDPNRRGVGLGPSVALDNKDGYLANGEHKAKNISPACSKEETRRSEIILITDEAPLTQEIEDTVKLAPLNATSEMRCVTLNTKEDPKEVACGAWCGPSVALDNKEGNLAIGECKTKSIYPTCCKEKARSEIILITDTAPLAQENDDAVKRTTFSRHIEDTNMIKESEQVATPTKFMETHDSDEDLRRKQEGNTVQLESVTVVDKCPNNSEMNTNGNVCRKYEAPGGSRCFEKWKKDTVSGLATPDGTGIIKPENSRKSDEKFVGNCGAMGLNPFEQWLRGSNRTDSCVQPMPEKIPKSGHIRTEIDHSVNGKGTTVQLQTKKEQLEPVGSIVSRQKNNMPVCANHAVARQSEHHVFQQEDGKFSNHVTPVALLPVKVEVLELDDHAVLKTDLEFCIPSTTRTWLELPKSLSNVVRQKGRQDRNVIMLKDPMKRLWPVFYHENSLFVGFTRGWKPFVAANNLQIGDLCMLFQDLDEDEPVYHVQITKK